MKKKELLKLIQELQTKVAILELQLQGKQDKEVYVPSVWPISTSIPYPADQCTDGKPHDYPTPWWGVTPPSCNKCGKPGQTYTATCSSGLDAALIGTISGDITEYAGCRQCKEDRDKVKELTDLSKLYTKL